jgi:2-polyprenyl-6-methoxyphenol hydroxylase-like FAD-dependent oxidoreductase
MAAKTGDYDVAIVGASLAGCTAAILLARAGARVALIEKNPDPAAFKRLCSHFIQASAVPTLERLGLIEPILAAGGKRSRFHVWTPWGWVEPTAEPTAYSVNLRREVLDPMIRRRAAEEPGVEPMLGCSAERLLRDGGGAVAGVVVRDRDGEARDVSARLTVGADGRDSATAALAGVEERTSPHGRVAYGAYFEGAEPRFAPDATAWMLDPDFAAAFPTDSGLVLYVAMVTKDRLPEFKADPARALREFVAAVPEPPPIERGRMVGSMLGKVEMTNRMRGPIAPGLALVGDAALASDPLPGIGCGWALQSGAWLADSVSPSLRGVDSLENGLRRYRKRHRKQLREHAFAIHDYSTGRKMQLPERIGLAAAARDQTVAAQLESLATRRKQPHQVIPGMLARSVAVNIRHMVGSR